MTDNRPKIDLKARLGKRPSGMPVPSGQPVASVPQPSGGGGQQLPAPSFGSQQYGAPMPGGAVPGGPGPVSAAQPAYSRRPPDADRAQSITIEMSEEVVQAQQGLRKRGRVIAFATLALGLFGGFVVGTAYQDNQGAQAAVRGAGDLVKDIDQANGQVTKLAQILGTAVKKLTEGSFPEDEVRQLGEVNVGFDGSKLAGRGIGRLKPQTVSLLIEYANLATKANDSKNRVRSLLNRAKQPLAVLLGERQNPRVHWGVSIQNGPHGPWATMQPLSPFLVDSKEGGYEWPADVEISVSGKKDTMARYTKGDPIGSDPKLIPVAPESEASVCSTDTLTKVRRELSEIQDSIQGIETPGEEQTGLLKLGKQLTEALKKVGTAG